MAATQLLILDVDETLVYADEQPLARAADFVVGPFHVYRRPFLTDFLAAVTGWFDVAVWSSASDAYVQGIVAGVFGPENVLRFVWSCDRCTRRLDPDRNEHYYPKNLDKVRRLGYPLERVLMLDDSPEKLTRHYGNHVRIAPFTGDEADTELRDLLPFLDSLRAAANVRLIEKRHWRQYRRS
jgi:RNA polymerase II subunit A small phosphatase-like protein